MSLDFPGASLDDVYKAVVAMSEVGDWDTGTLPATRSWRDPLSSSSPMPDLLTENAGLLAEVSVDILALIPPLRVGFRASLAS